MKYYNLAVAGVDDWTEFANSIVPMAHRYREPAGWQVGLTVQETTTYSLLRWDQPGDRLAFRTRSHIRRASAEGFYWVVIPQRGAFAASDEDEDRCITPGQAVVLALDRECKLNIPGSVAYGFQIPRSEFDHRSPVPGTQRPVLGLDSGLGRIAMGMINNLHSERSGLAGRDFNMVCDRITELLCLISAGDSSPQRAHLSEIAETVRRYVRRNIGTTDLRLPAVAQALGWSPRQLRVALHEAGTTYRDVRRDEALRAARSILEDPCQTMTIGEIAERSGLTCTWLATAFKARYGESPREFRKRRLTEQSGRPSGAEQRHRNRLDADPTTSSELRCHGRSVDSGQ
ncbi:helix-turn-helix domain-containing protein [Nocardia wallacei]|uniref:helix-turn-helix domain-containing protein n=1 Tax=Nocardia wallacei TaxID=480035 RepID=UPI002454B6EB|nr:helix-turn-helix domain-containing protein [Nocardia wallacei]